jgi:ATP-independent RNA helicase DbpA
MQNSTLQFSLKNLGISGLNNMQKSCIEQFGSNDEVILLSPTGSGKTLAFLLSIVNELTTEEGGIQALIITPTRELAIQIETVFKQLKTGFKINATYGGHSMRIEENNFSVLPAVLVGTPGRLLDHLKRENISLENTKCLVLDEFDKSLEMGFTADMSSILAYMSGLQKRLLVSATNLKEIPEFTGITQPEYVNFLPEETLAQQKVYEVRCKHDDKMESLFELLCNLPSDKTIIFCNHREVVLNVHEHLQNGGIHSVYYHGGLEQDDRERALIKFSNGSAHFLVATDLAARGLDIVKIAHVIHFQLPKLEAEYIHRNGRTSRQDHEGTVFVLLGKDEYLPDFIKPDDTYEIIDNEPLPDPPLWKTIYIGGGKKDKINKVDVVGFLHKVGRIDNNDIGLITVQDKSVLVAINSYVVEDLVREIRDEKIKGKRVKIGFAR